VMRASEGDKTKAAAILGVDLSTLYRKLKRSENN
jgi:DNA-binding protein Fis